MHGSKSIPTMSLDARSAERAIEQIELNKGIGPACGERRSLRARYQAGNLPVAITHPNGTVTSYSVIPRNLSTRGFAFIHGRFLYVGSPCEVELVTLTGESVPTEGRVLNCRHVTGITHEVSVLFNQPIDLRRFVELEENETRRAAEEYLNAGGEASPPVESFVKSAETSVEQLDRALESEDFHQAAFAAQQLKGSAGGQGFDVLAKVAQVANEALADDAVDVAAAREAVRELVSVIHHLRA